MTNRKHKFLYHFSHYVSKTICEKHKMNFTVFFSNVRLYLRDCAQKKVSLKIHLIVNRLECVYISSKNTFNTIWSENINL